MIMTQKYNSVSEIDKEFIPSLEELLAGNIPHFDAIETYEKDATENTYFSYYLFFGNQTNAPIGFAQLEITKDREGKKSFVKNFLARKKIPQEKLARSVQWKIPGVLKEGIVFDPKYSKYAGEKATEIFNEYLEREDVYAQAIRYSGFEPALNKIQIPSDISDQEDIIIDCLVKNRGSYQEFFESLSEKLQKQIKNSWKFVQRDLAYKMGEYSRLKDAFEYKDQGAGQYKLIKNHPIIKRYQSEQAEVTYLTLETSYEVKCLVLFIKGKGIHGFYDIINIQDEMLPEIIPHQLAILKFFEDEGCNRLHFLGEITFKELFVDLGFTFKKQHILSAQKKLK